jgi:hypothetical protein
MASKRKVLRKIQLGILPPNAVSNALLGPAAAEEATTVDPVAVDVKTAIEAFCAANPILQEADRPVKKTSTRRPTVKKRTTKKNKSS